MPAPAPEPSLQHGLFGQPPARAQTHRLFFALVPDDAVRSDIQRVATWLYEQHPELGARWLKPERFHATLNFLGDFPQLPEDVVEVAKRAAQRVRALPFDWTLDHAASFRGREPPCVLRSNVVPEPLSALWRDVNAALKETGLHWPLERSFTPHVTLAYARQLLPDPVAIAPIAWQIRNFVLIHNVVGRGSYQMLGDWPLSV